MNLTKTILLMSFVKERNTSLVSKKYFHILSKLKFSLPLLLLGLIPIVLVNKQPLRSNPVSEKVAFCESHASSYVSYNDPNYLENYEIVYNCCIKEIEKQ